MTVRPERTRRALALALAGGAVPLGSAAALAQAAPSESGAPEAAYWGAWGLIVLGLMLIAVGLRSKGDRTEGEGRGASTRMSLLRVLQARIDQETTGWRRLQWPILGLFFTGLGIATLLGWR